MPLPPCLGVKNGTIKIVTVQQVGALVADEDFNVARVGAPVHFNGAGTGLLNGITPCNKFILLTLIAQHKQHFWPQQH
jgi:hypothetical protein